MVFTYHQDILVLQDMLGLHVVEELMVYVLDILVLQVLKVLQDLKVLKVLKGR
jgi:hypothetical protein